MQWFEKFWHGFFRRPYKLRCAFDKGQGKTVVLLHGIASSGESWQHVIKHIDTSQYRIISLDLLGFGNSPRPKWLEYSVEDHANSVIRTLRSLKVKGPYILVGHSMGSLVAAEIAHIRPRQVEHLILHQMPLYHVASGQDRFMLRTYQKGLSFLAGHQKFTLGAVRVIGRAAAKLGGFSLTTETWHPFEMSLKHTILKQTMRTKFELTMPTDVIYGTFDIMVLRKNARNFFEPTSQVRFYTIHDIHRVATRSGALIADLITQNAAKSRTLSSRHGTLLHRFTMTKKPQDKQTAPYMRRRTAALWAIGFGALFAYASIIAAQGVPTAWELSIFRAINVWDAPSWYTGLARVLSDAVWVIAGIVMVLVLVPKTRKQALGVAVPSGITYVAGYVLEHVIDRARPDVLLHSEAIMRAMQDGPGFPSGHMMTAVAVTCALWGRMTNLIRVLVVLLLVLEGWSRLFLGVHFPLDILGGALIALTVWFALKALPRKLQTLLHIS